MYSCFTPLQSSQRGGGTHSKSFATASAGLYSAAMPFTLVQILYWTALSVWFGGVLFVALSPPIVLRVVRESNPILPNVLSANLDGQHGTLLGSLIVSSLATYVLRIELVAAIVMLIGIVGQWVLIAPSGSAVFPPLIRAALYIAAVVLLVYQWRVVWPRMLKSRQEYIDHADEPDIANPALDQLDRHQAESTWVLLAMTGLLLLLILMSAAIRTPTSPDFTSPIG